MTEPRRYLTTKQKAEVLYRQGGCCAFCNEPMNAPEYDHEIALDLGGTNALENFRALCRPCHAKKTKLDARLIAKSRRIRRKAAGTFNINRKRLQGRGFDTRLRKKINGETVPREGRAQMA